MSALATGILNDNSVATDLRKIMLGLELGAEEGTALGEVEGDEEGICDHDGMDDGVVEALFFLFSFFGFFLLVGFPRNTRPKLGAKLP